MTFPLNRLRLTCRLLVALLVFAGGFGSAHAALTIKITQGAEGAQPIAVVPFAWAGDGARPDENVAAIVADDLARTGRFEPLPFPDLPSRPSTAEEVNFSDWRILGTGSLVVGRITPAANGRFNIEFRLFDVFRARQLTGFQVEAGPRELRRKAHQISDIIYERLTGERGAFDTRVAYVTESGRGDNKRYALQVADSDGLNSFPVLESAEPVLSPAWSPDGSRLAYVSYEGGAPRVFVQDLASGNREPVAGFPGVNSAPAWSPDGRQLALTLSKDGNLEIYVMEMASRRLTRLTSNAAIDTEPAWTPDGEYLAFTSDRGGKPQIYRVPATGGAPERLTFVADDDYNARASFSSDGTRMTFVHGLGNAYRIAIMDMQNRAVQVLTDTRLDESPSFAPNGSMILYATVDGGRSILAAVSTDGRMRQQLAVQEGQVREPAWSPFRER